MIQCAEKDANEEYGGDSQFETKKTDIPDQVTKPDHGKEQ
jgi:hypothetical protein